MRKTCLANNLSYIFRRTTVCTARSDLPSHNNYHRDAAHIVKWKTVACLEISKIIKASILHANVTEHLDYYNKPKESHLTPKLCPPKLPTIARVLEQHRIDPCIDFTHPLPGLLGLFIAPMTASVARVALRGSDSNHLSNT